MVTLPYVIRVVGSSMEQFDFSIEEAAWSLGCPKGAAFFKVVLPNVTSGISSAFMLAFHQFLQQHSGVHVLIRTGSFHIPVNTDELY